MPSQFDQKFYHKFADFISILFGGLSFLTFGSLFIPVMFYINAKKNLENTKDTQSPVYKERKVYFDVIRFQLFPILIILFIFSLTMFGFYGDKIYGGTYPNANTPFIVMGSFFLILCFISFLVTGSLHMSITNEMATINDEDTEKKEKYKKKKIGSLVGLVLSGIFFPILIWIVSKAWGSRNP